MKKKGKVLMKEFLLNFLLRVVFGAIAIYVSNTLLNQFFGVSIVIGMNLWNLLTIGSLGISGFGLVFAVAAFSVL